MAREIDNTTFYKKALRVHKKSVKALHWNSVDSQEIRFEVLLELLPSDLFDATLVDAGCGFADFYLYLQAKQRLPSSYVGLDVMAEMVAEAQKRTAQKIIQCDILQDELPEADYYVCSGAMNILTHFETHLFIKKCLDASKKAFVFNLLKGKDDSMVYNYFTPSQIKKIAETFHCEVKIIEGYMPRDFSVALFKGGQGENPLAKLKKV